MDFSDIPKWCIIGKYIESKMYNPDTKKVEWVKGKIISYSVDGFFHKAKYHPVFHNKFSDYGSTVRECLN